MQWPLHKLIGKSVLSKQYKRFQPQSLALHRKQYARMVKMLFDVEAIGRGECTRPGEIRDCCFDFDDGMRLIISRERYHKGEILIHFSASVHPRTPLAQRVTKGGITPDEFKVLCRRRFKLVSRSEKLTRFVGFSVSKQVPHWIVEV